MLLNEIDTDFSIYNYARLLIFLKLFFLSRLSYYSAILNFLSFAATFVSFYCRKKVGDAAPLTSKAE